MPRILRAAFALLNLFGSLTSAYTPLSDETLRNIPKAGADFDIHTGSILAPILIPRVPGTPGSIAVQNHFIDWFKTNLPKWTIEIQNSTATTPATGSKQVPFANIIITRDPPWTQPGDAGRLALVAHYDSKLTPTGFIGATDSAAPCAMIMHAARSIDEALTQKWAVMEAAKATDTGGDLEEEKGVQIIFLDGEEAFVAWNARDSLYGARSLAEEWETKTHHAMATYKTALNSITLFLLLDLLGAPKPVVPSYFDTTHWAYKGLAKIESRLRSLKVSQSKVDQPFLVDGEKDVSRKFSGIEDDHLPFLHRGVEILHLIPTPFPRVWHHLSDDGEHLDMPTVEDWAQMISAFVGEWMDLEGHFPKAKKEKRASSSKTEL